MSMPAGLTLALRSLIGDGRYSMLRERATVQQGYDQYADLFRRTPAPRNILLGCPEYCNLGDHAIAYAERLMLENTGRPTLAFGGNMVKLLKCLREFVTPNDVIYLQGGGNMGSLYWQEERYRCDIISLLLHNKIVLFPQTISYDDTPESQRCLKHTQRVYGRHRNLHLIARETVSLSRMREYYPNNDVRLTPDIVLSLTDQATADPAQRSGVLLCMRNDVEKTTSDSAQRRLEAAVTAAGESWTYTDTTLPNTFAPISMEHGEELVLGKFDEFRHARLVITDRLHGMIFSAVTGTPCIAMNNSNGKVGFEYQWLKDFPYIHFANNPDEAVALVDKALNTQTPPPRHPDAARKPHTQVRTIGGTPLTRITGRAQAAHHATRPASQEPSARPATRPTRCHGAQSTAAFPAHPIGLICGPLPYAQSSLIIEARFLFSITATSSVQRLRRRCNDAASFLMRARPTSLAIRGIRRRSRQETVSQRSIRKDHPHASLISGISD